MSVSERLQDLYNWAKQSVAKPPTIAFLAQDRIVGGPEARKTQPGEGYFDVVVNQLFLAKEREWFKTYDPLVYSVAEFDHGTEQGKAPFVVGPQLIKASVPDLDVTADVVITNTRVAGPQVVRGERLTLTLLLCQMERQDYARGLVRGLERMVGAIDIASVVTPYLKIADAVMDGVEEIFGSGAVQLQAGIRHGFDLVGGLVTPICIALVATPELDQSTLWVRNGQLVQGSSAADAKPYRDADFVLVTMDTRPERLDTERLSFQPLWQQAKREAQRSINKELWEQRGRPALFTLTEAIYDNLDLTWRQQNALANAAVDQMIVLRDDAQKHMTLGEGELAADGRLATARVFSL